MQKFLEIHFVALIFLSTLVKVEFPMKHIAMYVKCCLYIYKTNLYVIHKDIHME